MALRRLSAMRRPSRTALTMRAKSSSSSTSDAASRATSVPRPPMATPIWAALSEGASLTPSPVMATISPDAAKAKAGASRNSTSRAAAAGAVTDSGCSRTSWTCVRP